MGRHLWPAGIRHVALIIVDGPVRYLRDAFASRNRPDDFIIDPAGVEVAIAADLVTRIGPRGVSRFGARLSGEKAVRAAWVS